MIVLFLSAVILFLPSSHARISLKTSSSFGTHGSLLLRWRKLGTCSLIPQYRGALGVCRKAAQEGQERRDDKQSDEGHRCMVQVDDFGHECPNTIIPVGAGGFVDADLREFGISGACVL